MKRNAYILGLLDRSLGPIPITDLKPFEVLAAVRKIEARGTLDSARKALELAGQVLRHGVATARLESDPARDLRDALVVPVVTHRAALIEPGLVGELLRSIDAYQGQGLTRIALQLLPHLFVRPGNLREAEWSEIDLEAAVWAIPAAKMKMRRDHREPLSRQVVELFRQAYTATGPTGYVFPCMRSLTRPISENTFNAALRRMGWSKQDHTAHGFRTTASTLLNESGLFRADVIEVASARVDSTDRGRYNQAKYWDERAQMAQWWSDYLDTMRKGAEIVPLHARAA